MSILACASSSLANNLMCSPLTDWKTLASSSFATKWLLHPAHLQQCSLPFSTVELELNLKELKMKIQNSRKPIDFPKFAINININPRATKIQV